MQTRVRVANCERHKSILLLKDESPPTGGTAGETPSSASVVRSPAPLVKGLLFNRPRLDSDGVLPLSDNDYSTDDDSTRIFYSETSTECSCFSQPDSRGVHQLN